MPGSVLLNIGHSAIFAVCCFCSKLLYSPCVGAYNDLLFHYSTSVVYLVHELAACRPTSTGKIGVAILNSLCAYADCRVFATVFFTFCKCPCSKISVFSCGRLVVAVRVKVGC